jgi:diadenosine tetraphosphatase ApaH/serine/threonine PP2A family protein phosphatase
MRTLILADIHSNIEALDAVLGATSGLRIDRAILLGDLVGYNAAPTQVLRRLQTLAPILTVRGNHDKVCAGLESTASFNPVARRAIEWTRQQLSPAALTRLAELPMGPLLLSDAVEICHGAPFDEDFYVQDALDARRAIESASTPVCLNAHTHVPAVYRTRGLSVRDDTPHDDGTSIVGWPQKGHLLINVGSVGQPRDGDPRAAFGVLDEGAGTIELRRVEYDLVAAQRRILEAGLPAFLADRLALGS